MDMSICVPGTPEHILSKLLSTFMIYNRCFLPSGVKRLKLGAFLWQDTEKSVTKINSFFVIAFKTCYLVKMGSLF